MSSLPATDDDDDDDDDEDYDEDYEVEKDDGALPSPKPTRWSLHSSCKRPPDVGGRLSMKHALFIRMNRSFRKKFVVTAGSLLYRLLIAVSRKSSRKSRDRTNPVPQNPGSCRYVKNSNNK
ncbi:hypothetical protein V1477_002657 [Vespula maculifrons]|uniref:Uncharacterized protein n=1 Tax=Vespula maculifrons TaxID=7453 RepID=A0ABD2CVD7_VESMC